MNAIEVLKGCLKQNNNKCVDLKELGNGEYQIIFTPEFLKILNEVCLALEKLDRLEKWLDNRIKKNQERLDWQKKRLDEPFSQQVADAIEQRIVDYKEVKEVLQNEK